MNADGIARLWNMQNLSASPIVLPSIGSSYDLPAFSPDGKWFAQTYQHFLVARWDMQQPTSKPNLLLAMNDGEFALLFLAPVENGWLPIVGMRRSTYGICKT